MRGVGYASFIITEQSKFSGLGRSFSLALCVSVLLNTINTPVSIQHGRKICYAWPMRSDYEETLNLMKHRIRTLRLTQINICFKKN